VVNDGSTDNTAEVISKFASDARLRCFEQKNAGVTAARNFGISAATSEYLTFVDSDDYLERDMYLELHKAITERNADVAVCNYNLVFEDHIETCYSNMDEAFINVSDSVNDYFYKYCACPKPNNYIWTRLYRTKMIKSSGVRFKDFKLGDDTLFNFMLLPFIKQIVNINKGYYNYLQRPDSNVYTVAKKINLAAVYTSTFSVLLEWYKENGFKVEFLPIHAYTRLRSIFFYSRIAGMTDEDIVECIDKGFAGTALLEHLNDISQVDRYAEINRLSTVKTDAIKRIMMAAVENNNELMGTQIE
jgi:glycosyltransferase EpsJ